MISPDHKARSNQKAAMDRVDANNLPNGSVNAGQRSVFGNAVEIPSPEEFCRAIDLARGIQRMRYTGNPQRRDGHGRVNAYAQNLELAELCRYSSGAVSLLDDLAARGMHSNRQLLNIRRLALTFRDLRAALKFEEPDASETSAVVILEEHVRDSLSCLCPGRFDEYL
jgi:predicted ATPase with chaperone activity